MKTVPIQRANHATTRQWRSFLWWRRVSVALGVVTWTAELALLPLLGDNPFAGLADDLYAGTGVRKSSRNQRPPFRSPALLVLPRLRGWPLDREAQLRRQLAVRVRGRGAGAGGSLFVDPAALTWLPARSWAHFEARELLRRWDDIQVCETLRTGRRSMGLTIHLSNGAEVWLRVRDAKKIPGGAGGSAAAAKRPDENRMTDVSLPTANRETYRPRVALEQWLGLPSRWECCWRSSSRGPRWPRRPTSP
jgi:hypothetical protein